MKPLPILLLMVLSSSLAVAQSEYDLSCDNVARIIIVRVEAENWNVISPDGYFYGVAFDLTEAAASAYREVRDSAPNKPFLKEGVWINRPDLIVTAHGAPLQNDEPENTAFAEESIVIGIIREEDAFAAARLVCPELVPDKVVIDGRLEGALCPARGGVITSDILMNGP